MDFPKKQQQCLIPRYLLQYLQDLQISHNDPTAPWGGGGGGSYTAGDGIDITNDVISIDNTVALKTDIPSLTGYATETWVTNQGYLVQSDLEDYITSTDLTAELLNYAELSDLATVATTGDYNDLLNKPTIPDAVSGTNDGTNWTSLTIGSDTYGIPSGGGSGSGPTITRYDTSSYMYYTNWTDSKTCTIYNGYPNSTEFRIENTNPGDILYFDITLSYYHFGFMKSRRKLIKVVVPVKSTNTSYLSSHLDTSVSYEMFQTGAVDLGNNFMTITIENITSASTNRVSMGELNVPLSWTTNTNNRITINAITHIAF